MEEFIARGVASDTPAAIVDNGTRANQRVVIGDLSNLYERAEAADLQGPALVIIGSVVGLNEDLKWFRKDPEEQHSMSVKASPNL